MGLPVVVTGVYPPAGGEAFVARAEGVEELPRRDRARRAAAGPGGESRPAAPSPPPAPGTTGWMPCSPRSPTGSSGWPRSAPCSRLSGDQAVKVLFVYKYLTLGGVEAVLRARLDGLAASGIEAHAWFFHDYGGRSIFRGREDRLHVGPVEECLRFARREGFDLLSSIDTEEVLPGVRPGAPERPRLVMECHSAYLANLDYLRGLAAYRPAAVFTPSEGQRRLVLDRLGRAARIDVRVVPNPLRREFVAEPAALPRAAAAPGRGLDRPARRAQELAGIRGDRRRPRPPRRRARGLDHRPAGRGGRRRRGCWQRRARSRSCAGCAGSAPSPTAASPRFLDAVRDSRRGGGLHLARRVLRPHHRRGHGPPLRRGRPGPQRLPRVRRAREDRRPLHPRLRRLRRRPPPGAARRRRTPRRPAESGRGKSCWRGSRPSRRWLGWQRSLRRWGRGSLSARKPLRSKPPSARRSPTDPL